MLYNKQINKKPICESYQQGVIIQNFTVESFISQIENIIENTKCLEQWIKILIKHLFKYLYPLIYKKYFIDTSKSAFESADGLGGFFPCCPPKVHHPVALTLIKLIKNPSKCETGLQNKEVQLFIYEIVAFTFSLLKLNSESYQYLGELKGPVISIVKFLLSGNSKTFQKNILEIVDISIQYLESCLSGDMWYTSFDRTEFIGIMDSLRETMKHPGIAEAQLIKMKNKLFYSMAKAADMALKYIESNTKDTKAILSHQHQLVLNFSKEVIENQVKTYPIYINKLVLAYIERLIVEIFFIIQSPLLRNNSDLWERLKDFWINWNQNKLLVLCWQREILAATSTLSDQLNNLSNEVYTEVFAKFQAFPGKIMKKEYSLQIVFNAWKMKKSNDQNYATIYKTNLYQTFEVWSNLVHLVKPTYLLKYKESLLEYMKTGKQVILKLSYYSCYWL